MGAGTGWNRCLCFACQLWAPHFERTGSPQLPRPRELLCWLALWTPCTRWNSLNMEPMVPRLKRPTCHLDSTLRIEPHSPTVLDPHCPTWCPTHGPGPTVEWHQLTLGPTPTCVMVALGQETGHPHPKNRSELNVQGLNPRTKDAAPTPSETRTEASFSEELVSEGTLRVRRGGPGCVASPTRHPDRPHW